MKTQNDKVSEEVRELVYSDYEQQLTTKEDGKA